MVEGLTACADGAPETFNHRFNDIAVSAWYHTSIEADHAVGFEEVSQWTDFGHSACLTRVGAYSSKLGRKKQTVNDVIVMNPRFPRHGTVQIGGAVAIGQFALNQFL